MNNDPFLPPDYELPPEFEKGNYFKFKDGENKLRVLSSAIVGYELWIDGKPIRRVKNDFTPEELEQADINRFTNKKKEPTHFWTFVCWNYAEKQVQILQLTQVSIINAMKSYIQDPDWGAPFGYDLVIVKEQDGKKVMYSVKAKPHKQVSDDILEAYGHTKIDLKALFKGDNPFS